MDSSEPERRGQSSLTPMMQQYREAKDAHPDCLLFFRMGDFFELFFDDAVAAAAALDITLTRRGQHDGQDIPMAGVPVHAYEGYLARLIRRGFKVAICDQVEEPSARGRGAKGPVRREVTRVVTQGTLTEDSLLEPRANNYLAAVALVGPAAESGLGLAVADITTGQLLCEPTRPDCLGAALARFEPTEVLTAERVSRTPALLDLFGEWRDRLTVQPDSRFDSEAGRRRLLDLYRVGTLDAFGDFSRAEIAAAGALIDYVDMTQRGRLPRLAPPRRSTRDSALEIDGATRRNLELTRTLAGERKGSLLDTLDRTVTGAGSRLLAGHVGAPLTDPAAIVRRLDAVSFFLDEARLRADVRALLRGCPDLERALGRISLGRGGPRDVSAVRDGLLRAEDVRGAIEPATPATPRLSVVPELVCHAAAALGGHGELIAELQAALQGEVPAMARDGGFILPGYHPGLDELRTLRDESRRLIAALQQRYVRETGITGLKIRHNNVLGYFVEVTTAHADKLAAPPRAETFIHRQTLSSGVRFTTAELAALERDIADAGEKALALELSLLDHLVSRVVDGAEAIAATARALAAVDVAAAQAELAEERRFRRPEIDDGRGFTIVGGRHPVVEAAAGEAAAFVPNNCDLSPGQRLWLLTGPNMAGKSTFLRQNALIALLAQAGGFVPAEKARLGVVDRLFSRIGAADELARGRSTFMVEMIETGAILNQATDRSLVILDEIGRGTATFDGLSIAWACLEHLHEVNRCRTLFATHYHELTALSGQLEALSCHTMRVKEWQGDIAFLHEVAPGAADRSYGIHVARLAGLPASVTERAQCVLDGLEQGDKGRRTAALLEDLPLFSAMARTAEPRSPTVTPARSEIERMVASINPDELSPRDALETLYRLRQLLPDLG